MVSPQNSTRPLVGAYTPVTTLKAVVLPAPLGPIRATISPSRTSIERSSTATTPPNCIVTFSSLRTGLFIHSTAFHRCFAAEQPLEKAAHLAEKGKNGVPTEFPRSHQALPVEQYDDHDDHREHHHAEAVAQQRDLKGADDGGVIQKAQPPFAAGNVQERAENGAGDGADAADNNNEQDLIGH